MYGLGTIINTAAIVAGGIGGALFGRFLKENVQDSIILSDVMGSDHCPVELLLEV